MPAPTALARLAEYHQLTRHAGSADGCAICAHVEAHRLETNRRVRAQLAATAERVRTLR